MFKKTAKHPANNASNDVHRPPLLISLTSQVKALFRWVLINCAELEVNLKLVPDVHLKAPRSISGLGYWLVSCQHTRSFDSEMFPTTFRLSALLLSVGNLITFKSCGGQLTQLVSTFSQLSVAVATSSSSWYHSQPLSPLNRSQLVS